MSYLFFCKKELFGQLRSTNFECNYYPKSVFRPLNTLSPDLFSIFSFDSNYKEYLFLPNCVKNIVKKKYFPKVWKFIGQRAPQNYKTENYDFKSKFVSSINDAMNYTITTYK